MVVQSVHLNDRFEHRLVCQKMDLVSSYYQTLGGLFRDAYQDVFPESIRSRVCGEASGTKLQSQIFLLLAGDLSLENVRETSQEAMSQFSDRDSLFRQYQYRSEVEAIAGQWEAAREFVGNGIGARSHSHADLASFISGLDPSEQGFPLLHWTRIGGMAAAADKQSELAAFHSALKSAGLTHSPWSRGEIEYYPAHGILRRLAGAHAGVGENAKVIETLRILRDLVNKKSHILFLLIKAAAVLQAAGIAGRQDAAELQRILGGSKKDPPVTELLEKLRKTADKTQPRIAQIATEWLELVAGGPAPDVLVTAAAMVAY